MSKIIKNIYSGENAMDGAGVKLNRIIASSKVNNIDPFFLLDEFKSDNPKDYIAGFPMHPHRGIETITYMIEGSFKHTDSRGGGGILNTGEVQWMTAGKGIQHEEMPEMKEGKLWGYQLWLNLPKKDKWVEAKYQHLTADKIPTVKEKGLKVIVISGKYKEKFGLAENYVPSDYFDIYLDKNRIFEYECNKNNNSIIYIHTGELIIDNKKLKSNSLIELKPGAKLKVHGKAESSGFLFLSAKPNNEEYSRGGPFVMNTKEEIIQAFKDYEKGTLF